MRALNEVLENLRDDNRHLSVAQVVAVSTVVVIILVAAVLVFRARDKYAPYQPEVTNVDFYDVTSSQANATTAPALQPAGTTKETGESPFKSWLVATYGEKEMLSFKSRYERNQLTDRDLEILLEFMSASTSHSSINPHTNETGN